MSDTVATHLVGAEPRRAVRKVAATRLIVFAVLAVELAWICGLSILVYEVLG